MKWDQVRAHMHVDSGLRLGGEEAPPPETPVRPAERGPAGSLEQDKELMAIFERTYGKVEQRAFQPQKKPARTSLDGEKYSIRTQKQGPEYLLVDGYNVIFAWEELERLVDLNVVCTISSVDTGLALNAVAENRSTVAEAHIQVDTGMGFGGFLVGEPEKILLAYRSLPNVALSGIYTQLHAVSPKGPEVGAQLRQFHQVLDAIHAAGFETGTVHAAGSYALMHCDLARMDAVRAGSVLLGRCRRTKDDGLSTVGHGEAGIAEMRWLPKGHTVGAEKTAVLKAPTRVAVVPVGYQHGFGVERPRPAGLLGTLGRWRRGRRLYVRVNGQRARVIGSVGVSETLVDVTDLKCSAGDVVSFDLDPMYARGCVRQYR